MTIQVEPFAAAVFDMDGTLVDTEPVHYDAYRSVLQTLGCDISEEEYDQFTGKTDAAICEFIVRTKGVSISQADLLERKEAAFLLLLKTSPTLLPGVLEMLEKLKRAGLKLAVASSSTLGGIAAVLDAVQIRHYFEAIASGEEVANSKPAPDVFLLAAKRLDVIPTRCLAFEDSENGTLAASAAGMYCIAIPCGATAKQNHSAARVKLASMNDLNLVGLLPD